MTDILFMRLFRASLITIAALILLAYFATLAFAQAAAPAAPPVGSEGILDVIRSSVTTGAVSLFTVMLAVATSYLPAGLKTFVDGMTTNEGKVWQGYVSTATGEAFDYARSKLGLSPENVTTWLEKNAVLRFAEEFMVAHYADIVSYVDKNGNGLPDILESALHKIAPAAPVADQPAPQAAPQSLMGATAPAPRRTVKVDPDTATVAQTFKPAAKTRLAGSAAMGSA